MKRKSPLSGTSFAALASAVLVSAALALAAPGALTAQSGSPTGSWTCNFGNTHPTARIHNWFLEFQVELTEDGTLFAQGRYYASSNGFWDPFRAQGRWWIEGGQMKFFASPVHAQSGHAVPFQWTLNQEAGRLRTEADSEYGSLRMLCERQNGSRDGQA